MPDGSITNLRLCLHCGAPLAPSQGAMERYCGAICGLAANPTDPVWQLTARYCEDGRRRCAQSLGAANPEWHGPPMPATKHLPDTGPLPLRPDFQLLRKDRERRREIHDLARYALRASAYTATRQE